MSYYILIILQNERTIYKKKWRVVYLTRPYEADMLYSC
jgi:hypothetical protein